MSFLVMTACHLFHNVQWLSTWDKHKVLKMTSWQWVSLNRCNKKLFFTAGGQNIAEAQEYRNFVVGKMCFEISEIIRVLQYTTYEEEGGDDPLNDMKKAASLFDSNLGPAMKWVTTPTESAGGLGWSKNVD